MRLARRRVEALNILAHRRHTQQPAATVLAVANGSRALGLALHAYVFEEAAARTHMRTRSQRSRLLGRTQTTEMGTKTESE